MSLFRSGKNDYFMQNKTKLVNSQKEPPGCKASPIQANSSPK